MHGTAVSAHLPPASTPAPTAARDRGVRRTDLTGRAIGGVVSLGAAVVLGLAAWMEPAGAGHGTHTQIGLPPCGWAVVLGLPCPTCGMTTAFAHAADGRLLASLAAQPMGLALALGTAVAFWAGLHVAATGSTAWSIYGKLLRPKAMWAVAALALAAWAYKAAVWPAQ